MKIYLHTLGCRLNEAEVEQWERALIQRGHSISQRPTDAEVIVLNTCAVTSEATRKSRQLLRKFRKASPHAKIIAAGCYPSVEAEQVKNLVDEQGKALVQAMISNVHKDSKILESIEQWQRGSLNNPAKAWGVRRKTRAFIKVQEGCRYQCTYCIVTRARGKERSVPIEEVVREIQQRYEEGFREVVLTGVHLGGYGSDLHTDLHALVQAILVHTEMPRIRLGSLEPWDIPQNFFALWENPRLCPHLHLPIQSGSPSILKKMGRRISPSDFQKLYREAVHWIPNLNITTDWIVGFPGETQNLWVQSLQFFKSIPFGHIHVFRYSPRPGTPASKMPNQVPASTAKVRSLEARTLAFESRQKVLQKLLGERRKVLWESRTRKPGTHQYLWHGYTEDYFKVSFLSASARDWENQITPVKITAISPHLIVQVLDSEI